MHPASIASNVERRVYESPAGCRQNTDCSNTAITWQNTDCSDTAITWQTATLQSNSWQCLEVAHWFMILPRMECDNCGLGAPTNENKVVRFMVCILPCHSSMESLDDGWKYVGYGMATSLLCQGLASMVSMVMLTLAGITNNLFPQSVSSSESITCSFCISNEGSCI